MSNQNSIRLHIDRLVVDEPLLSSGQSGALQAAIEVELSQLLVEGGLVPSMDTSMPVLNAGSVHVASRSRPSQFGRQIARSIHGALNPERQVSRVQASSPAGGLR